MSETRAGARAKVPWLSLLEVDVAATFAMGACGSASWWALAGVSTRTVRHYHHLGLLPEPERLVNGYREYRLRDAVVLAWVRRLAELGLALDEIRDVLATSGDGTCVKCVTSSTTSTSSPGQHSVQRSPRGP